MRLFLFMFANLLVQTWSILTPGPVWLFAINLYGIFYSGLYFAVILVAMTWETVRQ